MRCTGAGAGRLAHPLLHYVGSGGWLGAGNKLISFFIVYLSHLCRVRPRWVWS